MLSQVQLKGRFTYGSGMGTWLLTGSAGIQRTRRRSATTWSMYMIIYPVKNILSFGISELQPGARLWIDTEISGSTLWQQKEGMNECMNDSMYKSVLTKTALFTWFIYCWVGTIYAETLLLLLKTSSFYAQLKWGVYITPFQPIYYTLSLSWVIPAQMCGSWRYLID